MPRFSWHYLFSPLIVSAALYLSVPGLAQQKDNALDNQIKEVEKAIEAGKKQSQQLKQQVDELKSDISKASRDRIGVATAVQNLEQRLSKLETEIDDLNDAETEKRKLLESRRDQFSGVLMALQKLSRLPPEAVIAYPTGAADLIRTAILLRSVVPQIEGQAVRLREDLIALAATRDLIAKRKSQLAKTSLEFKNKRSTLDGLIRMKAAEHERALSKRREAKLRIESLSGQAQNLRDLFGNLEQERKKQLAEKRKRTQKQLLEAKKAKSQKSTLTAKKVVRLAPPLDLKPFALSRGSLRYPAVGRISGHYGKTIRRGIKRKGLSIETRDSAQIIAPFDGKVVFAGNFRGYGQLLIIDHGEGYHSLLAGMSRIDGVMGQYLLSGEPIGVMGSQNEGKPSLYIELRRNGQPINPVPWLAKRKSS
jgi:septal ring factor EnvC (AmiA/AmiB activator)